MGAYSSLAPGATTGGNVSIGNFSAIPIGAIIKHGIQIEEHCVVGAGALVLHNITKNTIASGTPAKPIRSREVGEKYL